MRRLTIALALMFIAASANARAVEHGTAYEALRLVGRQLGRASLNKIISVNGVDGDPQPTKWNILIADKNAPSGVREIQVANDQIISNQAPRTGVVGSSEGATISTSRLNLDSSGAFTVASYTADKSHVNFDSVSYTLRTNERGIPVWIVTLLDNTRQPLGTIQINANKGNVTRVEGMYHGANMADVQEDHGPSPDRIGNRRAPDESIDTAPDEGTAPGDEDENVVKRNIRRMFYRTREDAQRMFHRVRRSFADFIAGDRSSDE